MVSPEADGSLDINAGRRMPGNKPSIFEPRVISAVVLPALTQPSACPSACNCIALPRLLSVPERKAATGPTPLSNTLVHGS